MDPHDEQRHDETTTAFPPVSQVASGNDAPSSTGTQPGAKRLHRSRSQKMFMGVCGGLADYFDIDPTLMRAVFVATALLGGASIVVYLVLLVIMPAEDQIDTDPRAAAQASIDEAAAEIQRGVDLVVEKGRSLFGKKSS
jgi:phage shock protein C